jgi:sugar transferase (PEP-CTERM/EpsH1 system associated)
MEPLLLLAHRIPYPPTKGDKIRSYHLLRFLATRYRVHLGTFIDREEDRVHEAALDAFCESKLAVTLDPRAAKLRSVTGFLTGEALTLPYYRSPEMRRWVERVVAAHSIRRVLVYSGTMAQYVRDLNLHVVLDFVDVDSAKWTQYSERRTWPSSYVFRREGEKLLSFERSAAAGSAASVFVSRAEAELFLRLAPEFSVRVHVIENGVDSDYFSPDPQRASPFRTDEAAIVFTGAMDYWPNIDAATWFAREIMPAIIKQRPDARFYIVGMNPSQAVRSLASIPGVVVTGSVPDVRPYTQHASVVVAPLRVARGVQNKVLEAMAMARPVVVSMSAANGIAAEPGVDFERAGDAKQFSGTVMKLLSKDAGSAMGWRARARIRAAYNWDRNMAGFERLLRPAGEALRAAG